MEFIGVTYGLNEHIAYNAYAAIHHTIQQSTVQHYRVTHKLTHSLFKLYFFLPTYINRHNFSFAHTVNAIHSTQLIIFVNLLSFWHNVDTFGKKKISGF